MKQRSTTKRRRAAETDAPTITEPSAVAGEEPHQPAPMPHRRVREGELYYVADEATPEGWSVIEIASSDSGVLAAFALGQLEAIPFSEVEELILSPVQRPALTSHPRFAA